MSAFTSGPIAPERNPTIQPTYYSPRMAMLSTITATSQTATTVETTDDHQFVVGQLVRFVIPYGDGMEGLNEQTAYVTSVPSTTSVVVAIDATNFNAFNAAGNSEQSPFIIPVGDTNSGSINASGRTNNTIYIEGSFINISPE